VPAATAILDRFLHHAELIQITGRSYRLRNQQDGLNRQAEGPSGDGEKDQPLPKTGQGAPRVDSSKTGQGAPRGTRPADGAAAKKDSSKGK